MSDQSGHTAAGERLRNDAVKGEAVGDRFPEEVWCIGIEGLLNPPFFYTAAPEQARGWEKVKAKVRRYVLAGDSTEQVEGLGQIATRLRELAADLEVSAQDADPVLALTAAGRGDTASKRYHEGTATGLRKASQRLLVTLDELCPPLSAPLAAASPEPKGTAPAQPLEEKWEPKRGVLFRQRHYNDDGEWGPWGSWGVAELGIPSLLAKADREDYEVEEVVSREDYQKLSERLKEAEREAVKREVAAALRAEEHCAKEAEQQITAIREALRDFDADGSGDVVDMAMAAVSAFGFAKHAADSQEQRLGELRKKLDAELQWLRSEIHERGLTDRSTTDLSELGADLAERRDAVLALLHTEESPSCDTCGGSETALRQGNGEWLSEPCPDCKGETEEEKSHELKCWPGLFADVAAGRKTFEVRRDDRGFKVGDALWLREYDIDELGGHHTGPTCLRRVAYVLHGGKFGIEEGYVVLGIEPFYELPDSKDPVGLGKRLLGKEAQAAAEASVSRARKEGLSDWKLARVAVRAALSEATSSSGGEGQAEKCQCGWPGDVMQHIVGGRVVCPGCGKETQKVTEPSSSGSESEEGR